MADKYRQILSKDDRDKLGDPYLLCFKTCLAGVAEALTRHPQSANDQIAVILDRHRLGRDAISLFNALKSEPAFPYGHMLDTCAVADSADIIPLQAADMVAYEVFKRMDSMRDGETALMRPVLSALGENIGYDGGRYLSERQLRKLKPKIRAARCIPNGLTILPEHESKQDAKLQPHLKR